MQEIEKNANFAPKNMQTAAWQRTTQKKDIRMKVNKIYEDGDRMASIISDNYNTLQSLGRFGIGLGFGEKTVGEVCAEQEVDSYTFLAIVNFTINGWRDFDDDRLSAQTILKFLRASHDYYLDFQLPYIRRQLADILDKNDRLATLIMRLYDNYAHEVADHMRHEEETIFMYVDRLIDGHPDTSYSIDNFIKNHRKTDKTLHELKSIIIRYLPSDSRTGNHLIQALYNLYNNEEWLKIHAQIEETIFVPAVRRIEQQLRRSDVSQRISRMISSDKAEELSEREKEIVVGVAQGMSNKEIADNLFISLNTVVTHRRNIARKLQIHSPAGLTIYAIVNNLVDISDVRL